jgi:hypothetical protein
MIHFLAVSNFYSVRDAIELRLAVTGRAKDDDNDRFCELGGITAPKVISIWGANASGKSTVLRALTFLVWFVQHSFQRSPSEPLPCAFFNTDEFRKRPMRLAVGFTAPSDLSNETSGSVCPYWYELTLAGEGQGQPTTVVQERLTYRPEGAVRKLKVFERDRQIVKSSRIFDLREFGRPLDRILRPNVSLISTLVQLGHRPSIQLRDLASGVASNILVEKAEFAEQTIAAHYADHPDILAALNREIQKLDLGIQEMIVETGSGGPRASFIHNGLSTPLSVTSESHGTRLFVRIFPALFYALQRGGLAVVDELDNSIHPLLLPEIMRWFYDSERNPKCAQLWFTCQNASLLQSLAKEEVLICEKDLAGGTSVFALKDIKSVRRIENYTKKYLGGAYGGLPHIG